MARAGIIPRESVAAQLVPLPVGLVVWALILLVLVAVAVAVAAGISMEEMQVQVLQAA